MTLSRKQLGRLVSAGAIGLVCLAGSRIGYAQRAQEPRYVSCDGQAVTLVIVGDRGAADLSVAISRLTTVVFPQPIGDVKYPKTDAFDIYKLQENTLLVWPLDVAAVGAVITASTSTKTTDLRFRFSVVDDPSAATAVAMVIEQPPGKSAASGVVCLPLDWQSAMSALQAGIIADKDARIDELATELDELKAESIKQAQERARVEAQLAMEATQGAERRILTEVLKAREDAPPADDEDIRGKRGVFIRQPRWESLGGMHILHFIIYNNDPRAFRIGALRALDELAEESFASQIKIGKGDGPEHGNAHAMIQPNSRVLAAVMVQPGIFGKYLTLTMRESDGERTIVSDPIPTWNWTIPPEENEGRMSVDLQAVYGAIWLANPLDKEQLDPTSLAGLGARITYGMTKRISVEAEIVGARTGEAGFPVTDGELMRRAVVGRAQGGILARFGRDRYRPFMRLGLGLQGASHTAEMLMEDGSRMPGPDVDVSFDVTAAFGGGLDIRLGESFMAGIGVSALLVAKSATAQPTSSISVEAGIRLGYSWKP